MSTLVFDGDCGFCTTCVRWMARLRIEPETVIPWQHADLAALGLTPEQCQEKVQWVSGTGEVRSGHLAVAAVLRGPWRPLGVLLTLPGLSWVAGKAYDWVAAHRTSLPGGTPACALPPPHP